MKYLGVGKKKIQYLNDFEIKQNNAAIIKGGLT